MATYTELFNLASNAELRNKIAVACTIWANNTLGGTPTANQITLAKAVLENPLSYADTVQKSLLAEFNANTPAQITGASDAAIQTQTNQVLDLFVGI